MKLKRCYEIAPPRVQQYLQAEMDFVLNRIGVRDRVLELGCGYGRALAVFARKVREAVGIDTSMSSLQLARETYGELKNSPLLQMNALHLGFTDHLFDAVICIQNGISAFHVDPRALILESLRVLKPGGTAFFSSYSEKFWNDRLEWFRMQAAEGLLGEIDEAKTGNGVIVCKDGFTATTFTPDDFCTLAAGLDAKMRIEDVDESSVFCVVIK